MTQIDKIIEKIDLVQSKVRVMAAEHAAAVAKLEREKAVLEARIKELEQQVGEYQTMVFQLGQEAGSRANGSW